LIGSKLNKNKWICPEEVDVDGAEVKATLTNEEAPGVEEAASLADVPDHVEEDAVPASSLGSDAPITEQQSLPVESALLDVVDLVEDVPAITKVHMVANLVVQFTYGRW
jgi:hypothetical protein